MRVLRGWRENPEVTIGFDVSKRRDRDAMAFRTASLMLHLWSLSDQLFCLRVRGHMLYIGLVEDPRAAALRRLRRGR